MENLFLTDRLRPKDDVGMRLLAFAANHSENNLSRIAKHLNISESYCSKIQAKLQKDDLIYLANTGKTSEKKVVLKPKGFDYAVVFADVDAMRYVNAHPNQFSKSHPDSLTEIINAVPDHDTRNRIWFIICKYRLDHGLSDTPLSSKDITKIAELAAGYVEREAIQDGSSKLSKTHRRETVRYLNNIERAARQAKSFLGIN